METDLKSSDNLMLGEIIAKLGHRKVDGAFYEAVNAKHVSIAIYMRERPEIAVSHNSLIGRKRVVTHDFCHRRY